MPFRLPGDESKYVTDDILSYLCTLAMQKCSKKSEKKRASCGGAAMRKRLLIKNFVAQMLQCDRPQTLIEEGIEFPYEDMRGMEDESGEDPSDGMDSSLEQQSASYEVDEDRSTPSGHGHGHGEVDDDNDEELEDDEEEEEASEEEDDDDEDDEDLSSTAHDHADRHQAAESNAAHYESSHSTLYYCNDQNGHHHGQQLLSAHPHNIQPTPLPAASTLCGSGAGHIDTLWGSEETHDAYSLLSLTSRSCSYATDPLLATHDENLFYPGSYTGHHSPSYMVASGSDSTVDGSAVVPSSHQHHHQSTLTLGGYVESTVPSSDAFMDDAFDKCDKMGDLCDTADDEVSLLNGASFTSLVNMHSPVKVSKLHGFEESHLTLAAYRRSITDLDTNTVVEEDEFDGCTSLTMTTTSTHQLVLRSPKKRPLPFAQDDIYNLSVVTSPKRIKL